MKNLVDLTMQIIEFKEMNFFNQFSSVMNFKLSMIERNDLKEYKQKTSLLPLNHKIHKIIRHSFLCMLLTLLWYLPFCQWTLEPLWTLQWTMPCHLWQQKAQLSFHKGFLTGKNSNIYQIFHSIHHRLPNGNNTTFKTLFRFLWMKWNEVLWWG